MAESKLTKLKDGWYEKITRNRARLKVKIYDVALQSGEFDSREKALISSQRALYEPVASGQAKKRSLVRYVYIARDSTSITKIGMSRDVKARRRRNTDRPKDLPVLASWRFRSKSIGQKRERWAQQRYQRYGGGGGKEFFRVSVEKVLRDLTRAWGKPYFKAKRKR